MISIEKYEVDPLKHFILVKWNSAVTDKEEMARRAEAAFAGAAEIPGVSGCRIVRSCSERPNRYDLAVCMDLTEEGLRAYDASELHKNWKADFSAYFEGKAVFDCEG